MRVNGELLGQTLVENPHSTRIFSPDELVSKKLNAAFPRTGRNFQWDEFSNGQDGRVIKILSENPCQGFLHCYTLTGRTGPFPSYERFLGTLHTMMVQCSKPNKMVSLPVIYQAIANQTCRRERQSREKTSAALIISRLVRGPDRNTMASPIRTHPSLAPSST